MKKSLLYFLIISLAYGFIGDAGNNWFILNTSLPFKAASFPVIAFTSASDTNHYIIMPGGLVNDSISRRVLRLKASTGVIDELPPLPERSMNGAGFKLGDSVYFAGGFMPGWDEIKFTPKDTIFDIVFPSKDTGYAAGDSNRIFKTINSGANWTNVNIIDSYKKIYKLSFINSLTGWASCRDNDTASTNKIFLTTNGGANWTSKLSNPNIYYGLDFVSGSTVFIAGTSSQIRKTTDMGLNWSSTTFNTATWNSIDFIDTSTGFVCGTDGKVGRTTNGGANWALMDTVTTEELYSIKMLSSTKILAVGKSGTIIYSSNTGLDWTVQVSGVTYNLRDVQSLDPSNFVACGDNGVYLYSTNAGIKWNRRKGITPNNLYSIVEPLRDTIAYIGGKGGVIYKDNDSKFNYVVSNKTYKIRIAPTIGVWEMRDTLPKPLSEIFNSATTTKNRYAFIAGGLSTSNAPSNNVYYYNALTNKWSSVSTIYKELSEGCLVSFNDSQIAYVGGRKHDSVFSSRTNRGLISYLANGVASISWDTGSPYPHGGVFAHGGVGFKSVGIAVFVGGNVVVHHDNLDNMPPFDKGFKYKFSDDTYEPIEDAILPICHTGVDGFEITFPNENNNNNNVATPVRIFAPGGMTGVNYDLTDSIQIYKSPDISVNIEGVSNIVEDYKLEQNYPNPFNPVTNLEFNIRKSGFVKLSVYDLTGRQIAVLVNNELNAGFHKVKFDGNNFASGIYFYKLEAGDFKETKKMVLIK